MKITKILFILVMCIINYCSSIGLFSQAQDQTTLELLKKHLKKLRERKMNVKLANLEEDVKVPQVGQEAQKVEELAKTIESKEKEEKIEIQKQASKENIANNSVNTNANDNTTKVQSAYIEAGQNKNLLYNLASGSSTNIKTEEPLPNLDVYYSNWVKYLYFKEGSSGKPKQFYRNDQYDVQQKENVSSEDLKRKDKDGVYINIPSEMYFYVILYKHSLNFFSTRKVYNQYYN